MSVKPFNIDHAPRCDSPDTENQTRWEESRTRLSVLEKPQHLSLSLAPQLTVILGHHCLFRDRTQLNLDIHRPQTLRGDIDVV